MALALFDIPHKRAHQAAIEFATDIDSPYTTHEQRNALWANPRYSWVLEFEKSPAMFAAVRDFFIARKGRLQAFQFIWDGLTYTVRFDTDKLDFRINEIGYKTFSLTLVQVVTSE